MAELPFWIALFAWGAWLLAYESNGPARERRQAAERQAILDAIQDLNGDARSRTILDLVRCRLRYEIGPGRLYPVLEQLERAGVIVSRWGSPAHPHGPRPRLYRLASRAGPG